MATKTNKLKKPYLRSFSVEFSSHRRDGYFYKDSAFEPIVVQVEAIDIKSAINAACKKTLAQFIGRIPKEVANICWSRDHTYAETGYISVQYPRGTKLSAPYYMTKRMKVEVTLGNIPIQLCFNFGD